MKIIIFADCMRVVAKIVAMMTLLMVSGCGSWSGFRADDKVVARVGADYLYGAELRASMPSGLVGQDSINFAQSFISKWITSRLKITEAERIFSESESDIDRLVEEYRRSLLVRKLDQHYLDSAPMVEITDDAIEEYYAKNKGDFRVTVPMVKGEIVVIPDDYRRREQLLKLFNASKAELKQDFAELCRKNNFTYSQFESWISFTDYLGNLPLLRTSRHEELLDSRRLHQIHYDKSYYYYRITEALKVGEIMPLELARENIRQILINRNRADVVRSHEEQALNKALTSGHARIYSEQ